MMAGFAPNWEDELRRAMGAKELPGGGWAQPLSPLSGRPVSREQQGMDRVRTEEIRYQEDPANKPFGPPAPPVAEPAAEGYEKPADLPNRYGPGRRVMDAVGGAAFVPLFRTLGLIPQGFDPETGTKASPLSGRPVLAGEARADAEHIEDMRKRYGADFEEDMQRARAARQSEPPVPVRPVAAAGGLTNAIAKSVTGATPAARLPVSVGGAAPLATPQAFESLAPRAPQVPQTQDIGIHPAIRPLRDEGFRRAQDAASGSRLIAGLTRAGATAIGRGGDPGLQELERNAERPLQEFAAEQQQAGASQKAGAAAADADPSSPQSNLARQLIARVVPGIEGTPAFARMSYASIASNPVLEKYVGLQVEQAKARAAATERAERDAENREFRAHESALGRAQSRENAQIMAGLKGEERSERQQKELADDFDKAGVPGFYSRYQEAEQILSNPKYAKDLPGVGPAAGRLPDIAVSRDGLALRQAVGQMLAEYRKGITGAGMSESERAEYGRITGLMDSGDERAYRQGAALLKRAMDARVRSKAGGYRPDAVERYAGRVPWFESAMGAPAGRGETAIQPEQGAVRVQSPDGQVGTIDASEVDEATRNGWKRL